MLSAEGLEADRVIRSAAEYVGKATQVSVKGRGVRGQLSPQLSCNSGGTGAKGAEVFKVSEA